MGVKHLSFLPYKTVPETKEQFKDLALDTSGGSKYPKLPKGQVVWAYHDSFGAWGRFRYVLAKKRQTAYKPVYWSAAGKIAGVKGNAASALRAGVTCGLISNSSYGFIQVEGPNFFPVATDKGDRGRHGHQGRRNQRPLHRHRDLHRNSDRLGPRSRAGGRLGIAHGHRQVRHRVCIGVRHGNRGLRSL